MKLLLLTTAVMATSVAAVPALAADLAVSVNIGQPGFYGPLDVGGYPPPRLIYRQPVVIERVPLERQPIYLNVPPGHAKHWRQHCGAYNACGERVYFVQNSWYNREYVPRYHEYQRNGGDEYAPNSRGKHGHKQQGGDRDQDRGR